MKPILVCVHVYYLNLWPELKQCIANVERAGYEFDLIVTTSHQEAKFIAFADSVKEDFPKAKIIKVNNAGYDLWPFIVSLKGVELDNYSYIIKLHTKRDIDARFAVRNFTGSLWRDKLLSFCSSPEVLRKYIAVFESNPNIGMQNTYQVLIGNDCYDEAAKSALAEYIKQMGLPALKFRFIGGTMFIARASVFKGLAQMQISEDMFDSDMSHVSEFAHVLERLLGYLVYLQGMQVTDGLYNELKVHYFMLQYDTVRVAVAFLRRIRPYFYQNNVTSHGRKIIRVFCLPVYISRRYRYKRKI